MPSLSNWLIAGAVAWVVLMFGRAFAEIVASGVVSFLVTLFFLALAIRAGARIGGIEMGGG